MILSKTSQPISKKFLTWWEQNKKKFPKQFPTKMGYADWAEQFNNYQGMEDK